MRFEAHQLAANRFVSHKRPNVSPKYCYGYFMIHK